VFLKKLFLVNQCKWERQVSRLWLIQAKWLITKQKVEMIKIKQLLNLTVVINLIEILALKISTHFLVVETHLICLHLCINMEVKVFYKV